MFLTLEDKQPFTPKFTPMVSLDRQLSLMSKLYVVGWWWWLGGGVWGGGVRGGSRGAVNTGTTHTDIERTGELHR